MSRNIVLYIAESLDGYIAKTNGTVDWLMGESEDADMDYGYQDFYDTIDTVIMGRITYEQVIHELSPDVWVYEGKKCYVATTGNLESDSNVSFISGEITEFIKDLKKQKGRDIWLVGGSKLIDQFIKADLIDRYIITIIPTILGDGIPLFRSQNPELKLRLTGTKNTDGLIELSYVRR
ncbi:dihydrofolate reductase family protein [Acetobacterium bakii]|uniref:Riboflavin biosynthesis protein RibD n=1 Tax=Acetobacterium bakii TaxID=52689 RepID=A0A0L6TYG5_9FIRM|nr:dihydrofolate reductase family protein [Acetobacterium bakii]KNZ41288.1 riboflavin biosynthesis protein RibD [Acetobacterium bakii]